MGCYIWYSKEGPGRAAAPPSPLIAVPNVTAHPVYQCTNFILFDVALLPLHSKELNRVDKGSRLCDPLARNCVAEHIQPSKSVYATRHCADVLCSWNNTSAQSKIVALLSKARYVLATKSTVAEMATNRRRSRLSPMRSTLSKVDDFCRPRSNVLSTYCRQCDCVYSTGPKRHGRLCRISTQSRPCWIRLCRQCVPSLKSTHWLSLLHCIRRNV